MSTIRKKLISLIFVMFIAISFTSCATQDVNESRSEINVDAPSAVETSDFDEVNELEPAEVYEESHEEEEQLIQSDDGYYILNTNTMKFHYEACSSVKDILSKNREDFYGSKTQLSENGYSSCGNCNP